MEQLNPKDLDAGLQEIRLGDGSTEAPVSRAKQMYQPSTERLLEATPANCRAVPLAGKELRFARGRNRCLDGEKACRAGKGDRAPQGDRARTELAKP